MKSVIREALETPGRWRICCMQAGLSGNRNYYPDTVLREAVALFDGAKVLNKPDAVHLAGGGKSFDALVGRLSNPAFVPGAEPDSGEIHADLTLIEPGGPVAAKMREAWERGLTDLFGFSIDGKAGVKATRRAGVAVQEAIRFHKISSVDLIVDPGAGGKIVSCIEAVDENKEQNMDNETMSAEDIIALINAKRPDLLEGKNPEELTAEDLAALLKIALADSAEIVEARRAKSGKGRRLVEAEGDGETPPGEEAPLSREEAIALIKEKRPDLLEGKNLDELTADDLAALLKTALSESAEVAELTEAQRRVFASGLPDAAKARLIGDLAKGQVKPARIVEAIRSETAYLSNFVGDGARVKNLGSVRVVEAEADKLKDRLNAFFDKSHKGHNKAGSFKEIYGLLTGDVKVTGQRKNCVNMREAIGTADWSEVCADSINRELLRVYGAEDRYDIWRRLVRISSAPDFRELHRLQIGGYGDIPVVAEKGPYTFLNEPDDESTKFGVAKRGGLQSITLEMIKNDDVTAIQDVPKKLGWSAKRTLSKAVLSMYSGSALTSDGLTLFHASHKNLGTAPLNADSWEAARLAMKDQREPGSNDPIGIPPSILLVPPALERTAWDMFRRDVNLDKTFVQENAPEILSPWIWEGNDTFVALASPDESPCVDVAFLDGQQEPELFIQDAPTAGSVFSNDCITYKIKHVWGIGAVGWRGAYRSKKP